MTADQADVSPARRLGAEMRNRRLACGMSLRAVAKELGLSGHGTLVDYEHGRRIPPEDLIEGCERAFGISDGALRDLREKALAERAKQLAGLLLNDRDPVTDPSANREEPSAPPRLTRQRWWVSAAVACLLVIVATVGVWRLNAHSVTAVPATTVYRSAAPTSATAIANWGICWGGQVARVQPTDAIMYAGAKTLQVTVSRPNTAGDFATCTVHGLDSVHPGIKIRVYAKVSAPAATEGGLGFFVYDSKDHATWAQETPVGVRQPLPKDTGWHEYVWTVPTVDTVHTLGIEVYSTTDQPLIVWLGSVSW